MNLVKEAEERLRNVISKDENLKTEKIFRVLKSDLIQVLNDYFVFDENNLMLKLDATGESVMVNIFCKAEKVKSLNYFHQKKNNHLKPELSRF